MHKKSLVVLLALSTCGVTRAADLERGKQLFVACEACHNSSASAVGPSLDRVVGRPAAAITGFRYSKAMQASNVVWSEQALREFLSNPQARIPGNRMAYFGMSDARDVDELVAYLLSLN